MKKKILPLLLLIFFSVSFAVETLPSGLSENQVSIVKTYTLKALNLSLEAYNKVKQNRLRKAKPYIESAIFFLNEATIYSPSYAIKKKIEVLYKTIELFPDKNYKENLISLLYDLEKYTPLIITAESIKEKVESYIKGYSIDKNKEIKEFLKEVEDRVKFPLIDEPLKDAKTFLAIAYDNLRAGRKKKVLKSIEIAFAPINKLAFGENFYLVRFKVSIYKSYLNYIDENFELSKAYLQEGLNLLKKAYKVSSSENKDMIKGFINQLNFISEKFKDEDVVLKEFIVIIRQIRNL